MRMRWRHLLFAAMLTAASLPAWNDHAEAQSRFTPSRTGRAPAGRAHRLPSLMIQGLKYSADWSLEQAEKIKGFFAGKFGRELPISAMGQTETHDKLGFDHHDAMDVALNPDSREGRTLIGYLRQAKIPFIAFRRKLAGAATGPHIHIGNPSHRLEITQAAAGSGDAPETPVEAME
jgi:hypothetical protein